MSEAKPLRVIPGQSQVSNNGSLPHDEDSEKGLLCLFILEPGKVASKCALRIDPAAFYTPIHKVIYETLFEWPRPEEKVNFHWLKQVLEERGQLAEAGGGEGLNELCAFLPGPVSADYYIENIIQVAARRARILDSQRLESAARDRAAGPDQWDPDGKYLGAFGPRKLAGASFFDFLQRKIEQSQTLLGNRYLCRAGSMFIVAPSGHGKSVLAAQASIQLACGEPAFGIRPARPLRSLLVQSEDDDGDIIEMAQIVNHLKLTPEQRELVKGNTHVEFVNDVTGDEFLKLCGGFLAQHKFDLLWINPYTAYLGADIKDDGANTHFLRNGLNPLVTKYGCGCVILHHTPKLNFRNTDDWKPSDWMYAGAGAAVLTNWARAVLVIDPCENDVYKFIAAKRGKRIGWGAEDHPVFETYWAHSSDGKLLWIPATSEQIAAAKPKGASEPDDLLSLIPLVDPISQERLFVEAKQKPASGRTRSEISLKSCKRTARSFPKNCHAITAANSPRLQLVMCKPEDFHGSKPEDVHALIYISAREHPLTGIFTGIFTPVNILSPRRTTRIFTDSQRIFTAPPTQRIFTGHDYPHPERLKWPFGGKPVKSDLFDYTCPRSSPVSEA